MKKKIINKLKNNQNLAVKIEIGDANDDLAVDDIS